MYYPARSYSILNARNSSIPESPPGSIVINLMVLAITMGTNLWARLQGILLD